MGKTHETGAGDERNEHLFQCGTGEFNVWLCKEICPFKIAKNTLFKKESIFL